MTAKLLTPREIALQFHKNKIVELKETELSSGKKSPYYMDMRGLLAFPALMSDIIERMADHITESGIRFDKFASVPVGAVPFASQLSARMNRASVLVRDQPKQHGTKRLIEGRLGIDDRVILVEDVITTGASVIKTIQKLKNRGAEVVAVWSLLNREEGGIENITYEYKDIPVYSLFTTTDIFSGLVKEKAIAAYDWERIKYFQESQYKEMIRQMREKNVTKQAPDWETNRALYFATRFPHWIALQQQTPSNLILSLARPRIMTPNQITHILSKNRVPVPLIHTTGKDISPANLDQWNKETGGRVILDSGAVLGWNNNALLSGLDKYNTKSVSGGVGNEYVDDIRYDVATNHILISGLVDIDAAISNLAAHNETYVENGQSKKIIVISFNRVNVKDLVNDDKIWDGLDRLVAAMTGNNLGCCGLALKYSDMLLLTGRRDLWKRAPVCLWVDDWHLHPSMVVANGAVDPDQHTSWSNMNSILEKLKPWQIIMDEDVISSPYPIIDRIGQYSQFFKSEQITGLITEIREKIYKSAPDTKSANATTQEAENSIEITNALQYYKTALRYFARIREPVAQPGNNAAQQKKRNNDAVKGAKNALGNVGGNGTLKKISANEICQDIFQYCCEQIAVGYTFVSDVIATRATRADTRATLHADDELNNKKMN
jgi:orotate phosphoribosyltransferase